MSGSPPPPRQVLPRHPCHPRHFCPLVISAPLVIPAEAGIHVLDSRLRRNDDHCMPVPLSPGITDKTIRRLFRRGAALRPFDKLKAPQTQRASSTGWTLRLSEGRGCEGRGDIGVRFDRLNELGDEKSLSLRRLRLLVASRSGFHAAAGSFRRGRPPCLPCIRTTTGGCPYTRSPTSAGSIESSPALQ